MDKFKVGIIGAAGRIAAKLEEDPLRAKPCTHLGAYAAHPECEVVALCDNNDEELKKIGGKMGISNLYTDYQKMLSECRLDIVSVATPTETHCQIVRNCVRHQPLQLIFCEKPIASTVKEAERMIKTCEQTGVKLAVNHSRRWDLGWNRVKKLVDQGVIGGLKRMIGLCSGDPIRDGVHMADLFLWFGKNASHNYIDLQGLNYLVFEMYLYGVRGAIKVLDNGRTVDVYQGRSSENYVGYEELGKTMRFKPPKTPTPMLLTIQNLVNALHGEPLKCTGQMGLDALRMCMKWSKD